MHARQLEELNSDFEPQSIRASISSFRISVFDFRASDLSKFLSLSLFIAYFFSASMRYVFSGLRQLNNRMAATLEHDRK